MFIDLNECREGTSDCEQICENNAGSYTCICDQGYILDVDGVSCNGKDGLLIDFCREWLIYIW